MPRVLAAVRTQAKAVLGLALIVTGLQLADVAPAMANPAGTGLVINEYSGGNGTGTGATDEYVELYNPTSATITFTGTIQYKSAAGSTYTAVGPVTTFVVPAHGYWLVAGINYSGVAVPDSRYSFDGSASTTGGGHIALTGATTGVTTPASDPLRVDLLGFGTANTPEGTAAPNHPAAGGSLRRTNGIDTDNNSVDFVQSSTRSPRSSTSPATTLTDPGSKSFSTGTAITPFSLSAAGGRAPYTYAVSAGSLPAGLALDSTTGEISGTPTVAQSATDVTVRAGDANGEPVFRTFSIAVTSGADPVVVTSPGTRNLTVGTALTPFSLATSGGVAPYTYAVTGGALPAGVELDADSGEISGTPTAARVAADVTVTATDADDSTGSTTFSVAVAQGTLNTTTPTIDDTEPAVDDVLTASAGTWGPAPVQLAYQWLADGAEIDGATGATLTVTNDLVGSVLAVRVTGTKAEYGTASVESLETSAVATRAVRFTTPPAVAGTLAGGQTLSADPGVTDPVAEDVSYQWNRDGAPIGGATEATYVLTGADVDADISVSVTASVDGYADATATSTARGPVVAGTFTTGPTASISGTAVVGGTLTAGTGTTSPAADSLAYAWTVGGASAGTASTLAMTPAMVGKTVSLSVTAKRDGYTDAADVSDPTGAVAPATFTTGPTASISGAAVVGGTLTAGTGTTSPAADSFSYAWTVGGASAGTASTLALTSAMVGKSVTVRVTAERDGYTDAADVSDPAGPVAGAAFTTGPTASISGTAVVGGTLTAGTGTTSPAADSFAYAWTVGGSSAGTASTLALTPAMTGKTVTVTVTAKRDGYTDAADVSDPTGAVAPATFATGPTASISGAAVVGETLTAGTGSPSPAADSFAYAWTVGGAAAGTASTLALTPAMVGKTVMVTVTAKRDGYADAADVSDPTGAVAPATFTTGPTASISGTAVVGGTLTAGTGTTSPAADSFSYAWTVGGAAAGTASTLTLTPAMAGETVTVSVTARRDGYVDAFDVSDPTAAVALQTFTTGPTATITGSARVGQVLTASAGSPVPTPETVSYRWYADESLIAGANASMLTLTREHAGRRIAVEVVALRAGFTSVASRSSATVAVVADSAPRLVLRVSGPGGRAPSTSTTAPRGATVVLTWSSDGGVLRATGRLRKALMTKYDRGPIPSNGRVRVRLGRLGTHRFQLFATSAAGTTAARTMVSVVRVPKRLQVQVPATARSGATITVRVSGLGTGESYSIAVSGPGVTRQVFVGRARRDGVAVRRVSVPEAASSGKRLLRINVTGSTVRRTGGAVVRVR